MASGGGSLGAGSFNRPPSSYVEIVMPGGSRLEGRGVKCVCAHTQKKNATAQKNRVVTSSRQRLYLVMSTILALEALAFTDSTPFMQPSFDS
jgi:hypothetical protein